MSSFKDINAAIEAAVEDLKKRGADGTDVARVGVGDGHSLAGLRP